MNNAVDIAKLDADARRVLVALSEVHLTGGLYGHSGLPPDLRTRRRLLGLDPPSLMGSTHSQTRRSSPGSRARSS